jgi:hypothetical protein
MLVSGGHATRRASYEVRCLFWLGTLATPADALDPTVECDISGIAFLLDDGLPVRPHYGLLRWITGTVMPSSIGRLGCQNCSSRTR